ncbi:MAG: hypothetical protein LBL15_03315 [Oscillospiraceae bacterium]|nr:hypothetical protein [Oscillospiraceae bacterium]
MKKLLSVFLALLMLCALSTAAFADLEQKDVTEAGEAATSVTLSYDIESSWEVSLPSGTKQFGALEVNESVELGTISVTEFVLPAGKALYITVGAKGANFGDTGKLTDTGNRLSNEDNDDWHAVYKLDATQPFYYNTGVTEGGEEAELTATITDVSLATAAGAYSSILNFNVAVDDVR